MPLTPKKLRAKPIRFSGNDLIWDYLTDLVNTGRYGRSAGEAAERLVSQGIERAIERGLIKQRWVQEPPKEG